MILCFLFFTIVFGHFKIVFGYGCPDDWKILKGPRGHLCYLFDEEPKNFSAAENSCEAKGGNLVTIKNELELDFLVSQIEASEAISGYWIGLKTNADSHDLKWTNGETFQNNIEVVSLINKTNLADELCGVYKKTGKHIAEASCLSENGFVCQKRACTSSEWQFVGSSRGPFCYRFFDDGAKNYDESKAACEELQASLITIHTVEEKTFFLSNADKSKTFAYYLGSKLEGDSIKFKWNDEGGDVNSTLEWSPNEPSGGAGEQCLEVRFHVDEKLNDVTCHDKRPYACQKYLPPEPKPSTESPFILYLGNNTANSSSTRQAVVNHVSGGIALMIGSLMSIYL